MRDRIIFLAYHEEKDFYTLKCMYNGICVKHRQIVGELVSKNKQFSCLNYDQKFNLTWLVLIFRENRLRQIYHGKIR